MRGRIFLLLVCALVLLAPAVDAGQLPAADAQSMARYFPADTLVFVAAPIGEDLLNGLDSFMAQQTLITGQVQPSLREMLDVELRRHGTNVAEVLSWLGDYGAFGMMAPSATSGPPGAPGSHLVVEITDRAKAEAFLERALPITYTSRSERGYTIFTSSVEPGIVGIDDNLLILTTDATLLDVNVGARLDANPQYQRALGQLPADHYIALAYMDLPGILQSEGFIGSGAESMAQAGLSPEMVGPLALGVSELDERSVAFDSAQLPGSKSAPGQVSRIDPDFVQNIPANASSVIHATDLSGLYNTIMATVRDLSQPTGGQDPALQIEMAFRLIGLDLQRDILSWTTGDYAFFFRVDVVPIIEAALEERIDVNGRYDFGLVIEATDPIKARAFADKLGQLIASANQDSPVPGVTVGGDQIGVVDVTTVEWNLPLSAFDSLEGSVVIGTNERVFFIATRPAAQTILSRDGVLTNNPAYVEASRYFLPDPTFVWYADGEGTFTTVAGATITALALLGPAIGNIFDDIVDELQQGAQLPDSGHPRPMMVRQDQSFEQILEMLRYAIDTYGNTSLSATVTPEGVTLLRFVTTYKE